METKNIFIDADGIERPLDPHAHVLDMPVKKVKKITKRRQLLNNNLIYFALSRVFQTIAFSVLWVFMLFKYRLKIENKKAYKSLKKNGAILICNHCHVLDTVAIRLATMGRTNYLCSRIENFSVPFLGVLIKLLGTIPIPDNMQGMRYYKEIVDEQLQKHNIVSLLPETAMWPFYRSLRPFKTGAFRFAVQNKVPLLPTCLSIDYKIKKNGKKKARFTFTFFNPIYLDKTLSEREAVEEVMIKAHEIMKDRIEQVFK